VTARDVRIEHRYPNALGFLQRHGPEALVILHDLLVHAERHTGELRVQVSVREIADRLGFVSKDTVHRRLRQLTRAGIVRRAVRPSGSRFARSVYVLHLDDTGITLIETTAEPLI